jgi:cytochrome c peroxidase
MRLLVITLAFSASIVAQGGGGPPQPLPPRPVPAQNPITPQKAILGKLLFWEEQLSSDNRVACGTCHTFSVGGGDSRRFVNPGPDGVIPSPDDIFASPGLIRSDSNNDYMEDPNFGFNRQVTGRSAPSFLTAAWFTDLFWDGRARGTFVDPDTGATIIPAGGALESQALGPVLSTVEMAHDARTLADATSKLSGVKPMALATNLPADMAAAIAGGTTYPDLFQAAFGSSNITAARMAMAIATYQRTLVPDQTPYDAFVAGNPGALTPQQANGLNIFLGPGRCVICHTSGLFSDRQFHNLGLRPISEDNGRQSVTGNGADAGRFKTPSLRNIGLRNSFMHNGQFTTIGQVFGFYLNGGGPFAQNKDPQLIPLQVGPQQAGDLINFLTNALTDPRVAQGLAPFDRPRLRSQILPSSGLQYGLATVGSGGAAPQLLSAVPANLGNIDFKVGVHNALGGAASTLVISTFFGSSSINGVQINLAMNGSELFVPWTLSGAAGVAGEGYGTLRLSVPADPSLSGLSLFSQWFVYDGGVATGASATRGARIDLF